MVAIVTGTGLGIERSSGFVLGSRGQLGDSAFGRYGEAVTVNAATGNLLINRTDEILIGRGPDSAIARSYNSLGDMTDDNGDNWQLGSQRRVAGLTGTINTAGSTITRYDWDGSDTVYTWDAGSSAYVNRAGAGAYDRLTFASNIWTWTDGNSRVTETYDDLNNGRITSGTDTDNNQLTYSYTGNLLTRVTTASGEYTDLSWSGNNLTQLTTTLSGGAALTRTIYTYDAYNRLSTVTTDLTPDDNSITDNVKVVTTYTYDGTSKRIASISQTGGALLQIGYVQVGADYRVASYTETSASGATRVTSFSYDTANRITTITDPAGQVSKLYYDTDNQLVRIELPPAQTGISAQNIYFTYNANGDVLTAKDGAGKIITYEYDANGNVSLERDHLGNTITRTWGLQNELLTETRYLVADPDGAGAGQPSGAMTTRYAYDVENHLRYVISAEGYVTEYKYFSNGQLASTVAYRDNVYNVSGLATTATLSEATLNAWTAAITDKSTSQRTDMTYDFRGNVSSVKSWAATTAAGAGTGSYTSKNYVYDQFGNLLSSNTNGFMSEVYTYDGLGRLTGSTDISNNTTNIVFTDSQNKTVVTLANGLVKTSTYNLAGELITYAESGSGITTGTASYKYDALGQLRMVTDATARKSYYLYDNVGRKIADISADGAITEYGYNGSDLLVKTVRYANRLDSAQLASLVDANGNPANVDLAGIRPAASALDAWEWRIYHNSLQLAEVIDNEGRATRFDYDGSGNLVKTTSYYNVVAAATVTGFKTTTPTNFQLPTTDTARDNVTRNFYDNDGRLTGALDGRGYLSQIIYNEAGEKIETITYDTITGSSLRASGTFAQLLTSVGTSSADIHNRYFYDGRGFLIYSLDANLRPTEYRWDQIGTLDGTIEYGASIGSTSSYSLAYIASQISSLSLASHADTRFSWSTYDTAGRVAFTTDATGKVTAYSYDSQNQAVKAVQYAVLRPSTSFPTFSTLTTWVAGQAANTDNRISRMVYNARGQIVYEVDAEGFVTEHQYDTSGRVTKDIRYPAAYTVDDTVTQSSLAALIGSVPSTAVQNSYSYDSIGRLADSYDGVGVRTHYVYDALDRVTDKTAAYGTTDAVTTHYTYDESGNILTETMAYGATEASTTTYTYDGQGHVLTMTDGRGYVTTYTYDNVGNILTVTRPVDSTTSAITTYEYDAFGNAIRTIDARGNSSYSTYDLLNRQIWHVDEELYVTKTTYTIDNAVATVTRYAARATGYGPDIVPTVAATSGEDATTTFSRDKLGRVTKVTDAMGFYEQYTLNAFGDRISVRNKLGGIITNIFDGRGLLIQETLPMESYVDGLQASSVTNRFSYDARGNRTQMIEAFGLAEQRTTSYAYDKNDRLLTTTGQTVATASDTSLGATGSGANVETIKYDNRGNIIEVKNAAGNRTLSYYDDLNRKIAEISPVGMLTAWTYDANGNALTARVYGDLAALPATAGGTPPAPVNAGNYRQTSYSYDRSNRLLTSTVASIQYGYWNGSTFVTPAAASLVTTSYYDAGGNIIRQKDARGNSIYYFYDKLGRKIAQADQENYYTAYTLDADGNVTSERRYATRLGATPTAGTLPTAPATNANDRITAFIYDRNGRRITEQRTGVVAWAVNSSTGALTAASSTTSTVSYTYNGLGEVTRKTEATGNYTEYFYDVMGRQTSVRSSAFTDYNSQSVKRLLENTYDGLNNLTTTTQRGVLSSDNVTSTGESARITRYYYNKAGWLIQSTDAENTSHYYDYDIAGRLIRDRYLRTNNAGTATWEAQDTRYDAAGRATTQAVRSWSGTAWATPVVENRIVYSAYGEVSKSGLNTGSATTSIYQENFDYDSAGRVWRSTSEDGTRKLYLYDQNGNQSAVISSSGAALPSGYAWSSLTVAQAIDLLTASGTDTIGDVDVAGMVVTLTAYDKRDQNTETREPLRETAAVGGNNLIRHRRVYNAFGEVAQEIDARGYTTDFSYNTMGRLIQRQSPTVSWTAENGVVATSRPTENYYYDISGRLVGIEDANGNLNTRYLLAGTGYGGEEALVYSEFHADGGKYYSRHDVFNDLRKTVNEVGKTEYYFYDRRGLLTQQAHEVRSDGTQLIDYYGYDQLGQRIWHYNSLYGSGTKDKTDYDLMGRVISAVDMGGNTTTYSYSWSNTLATTGLGTFGGWTKTTDNAASNTSAAPMTEKTDYFGRLVDKIDFGGHDFNYTYDIAGRLTQRTNNLGETITYSYYNTGKAASVVSSYGTTYYGSTITTTYKYDVDGNRTFEGYSVTGTYTNWLNGGTYSITSSHQQATVTWDAANRMTSFVDTGASGSAPVNTSWEYDLAGNIRRMKSTYRALDTQGNVATTDSTQEYWYRYDNMNRFVTTKGMLSGTNSSGTTVSGDAARGLADATIKRGTSAAGTQYGGLDIAYDLAGQRKSATRTIVKTTMQFIGGVPYVTISYYEQREDYSYTPDGYLADTRIAIGSPTSGSTTPPAAPATGTLRATYTRDVMGRVTNYVENEEDGTLAYSRAATYNSKSQVTSDVVTSVRLNGEVWVNSSTYYYNASQVGTTDEWTGVASGGVYMGGVVTRVATSVTKNGATQTGNTTTYNYKWWDGALQSKTNYVSGSTNNNSTFYYDEGGHLQSVYIQDGRPRTVSFITDSYGQVLQRDEADNNSSTGDPRELHYYFGGIKIGDVSNNGPSDVDYATGITQHQVAAGSETPFQGGATAGTSYADFDQSYDPVNGLSYESTASRYVVQAGDTLETIAQQVWGDAAYWYMIADANGLSGNDTLVEGMSLTIPNKVHNAHNNTTTWKVYDPNEAIGDTAPTAAKPPKKAKCGVFGMVLLAVVAVAVAVVTAGAAVAAASPAISGVGAGISAIAAGTTGLSAGALIGIGAASGALGSVVSQGVGLATGIQDRFSWKGVALAGLAGGVAGGIGAAGLLKGASPFLQGAARGTLSSALTQGIGVVTGLQSSFSWAGVAAAGLGGGVGNAIGASSFGQSLGKYGSSIVSGMAGGIAGAAAQSLVTGEDFGDTLIASLPSIIGNTIGNLVADGIAGSGKPSASPQSKRFAGKSVDEIADLRIQDAAKASGDTASFLSEVKNNTDLRAVFVKEARIIAAARDGGYSLSDAAGMIGADLHPGQATSASGGPDVITVTGDRTFGDAVANTLVSAQDVFNSYTEGTRDIIGFGLAVLRGGPVGAIGGYAINQAVSQTLAATGLDKQVSNLVTLVGASGLSILSSSRLYGEGGELATAQANGRESGLLVEAGSTILGVSALRKLGSSSGLYRVGSYNEIKGTVPGLDAHHVGQKVLMGELISGYNPNTAPAILVPKVGHTIRGPNGIVSRSTEGLTTPRSVIARDIRELRRVYPDIPNARLQELIQANKTAYPEAFVK